MLGFFAAFVLLAVGVTWILDSVLGRNVQWRVAGRGIIALAAPGLVAAGALYAVMLRRGYWSGRQVGWPERGVGWALARGVGWGVGLAAAVLALAAAGGARVMVGPAFGGESYLAVALPLAFGLGMAALLEELLFRGYPLTRLSDAVGPVAASVVLSLAFCAAHLGNPDVSGIGLANIALAALLLSAVFLTGGGLVEAFGLHLGWNGGLALAADAPVSGLRFALPAVEYFPGPRDVWTGGRFGPEGGVAATIVLAGALAWRVRRGWVVQQGAG